MTAADSAAPSSETGTRTVRAPGLLAPAAVAVTLVLWASAFVAIRHLADDFSAGSLALGRLAAGALALAPVALVQGLPRPSRRQWVSIVTIGVLWFGIYNLSLNAGEQRVDAGTAAMLIQVAPVLIAALAAVFLGERFSAQLAVGLALAFSGVVVIGLSTSGGDSGGDLLGVVLCLVPAAVYAVSVILQKPLVADLSAVHVTWLACSVGVATCLPWAGRLVTEVGDAPVSSTLWLVYLGVFPTAIAFTTYAYALRHMTASALGVTTYLVPPLTIVMGLVLLDEVPPAAAYAGGVLALLGVGVARRTPARTAVVAPAVPGRDPVT
ncbi:DMT family transporter [Nocardioides sp. LHD-245]|uniref:DMT family transporter n=1 Tax=Nocardioides sp. LHD-245 TaxID=3051387 RepID=UPI0027E09333|nr:DMT family transporter [Nocardioides sp. LHD-245]